VCVACDEFDPLMPSTRAVHHWTTANLGEAAPGVLSPLGTALWGATAERAARRAPWMVGMMHDAELTPPADPADWYLRVFYGRLSCQVEYMATMGDRVPGTTGPDAVRSLFGDVPPGIIFSPTRHYYASIAWRLPRMFLRFPAILGKLASETDAWWRDAVARVDTMTRDDALTVFNEAVLRFEHASCLQMVGTLCSVQPLYDAVERLIARTGVGDIGVLSGTGGAEMAVIADIWKASRRQMTIEQVIANHGFHGPGEGEISSAVWRQDDKPLRDLIARYAERPERDNPIARERERTADLTRMQAALLAALPHHARPGARLILRLAARRIPLRGVGKRAFLQSIDAARASARRVGDLLVEAGNIRDASDIFFLTGEELLASPPDDLEGLVERRRLARAKYQALRLTSTQWVGVPDTEPAGTAGPIDTDGVISGIGVSGGVVEGTARVVTDPSFAEVEPDEVLIAQTTDPSWSSIMFISSALVVDIGGALSHAAVVARELGIPCVVNTGHGTKRINTGDQVRVDGSAGTVEIVARKPVC
jgi:phosphohistidine swiveling domain-containing protein